MKRTTVALISTVMALGLSITAYPQGKDASSTAVGAAAPDAEASGAHYEVRSQLGADDAEALAKEMEKRFSAYQMLFRFDPSVLKGKLKVRAFSDKAAFDAYLTAALGSAREEASYLYYEGEDRDRSELVVLRDGTDPEGKIFANQAFVQYFRSFIPNPPSWMREGFAIYFEGLGYDAKEGKLTYEENLAWLETVKGWGKDAVALASVLLSDVQGAASMDRTKFAGASWALVSFLLNVDDQEYRRTLYESFMTLDPNASAAENERRVASRAVRWIDPKSAEEDCKAYLASRKTFPELVEEGRAAYAAKDAAKAERLFMSAADTRPTHYAPHYYLGLLAYERKDFALAENHFRTAEQLGADAALVNYALGVNAAADGRKADAIAFLEKAKAAAPARYASKADELIARLK